MKKVKTEMVTITKAEYDELVKDQKFLIALQAAGVDNWDGYEYANSYYEIAIDALEE